VAFTNTAMGVDTLIFGFLGVLAQIVGIPTLIVVLIVLGLAGSAVSYFLPENSKEQSKDSHDSLGFVLYFSRSANKISPNNS
jgi:hypothetical protein